MLTITEHDLAHATDAVLRRVAAGHAVTVTLDGVPVARVCPLERRRSTAPRARRSSADDDGYDRADAPIRLD